MEGLINKKVSHVQAPEEKDEAREREKEQEMDEDEEEKAMTVWERPALESKFSEEAAQGMMECGDRDEPHQIWEGGDHEADDDELLQLPSDDAVPK